MFYVEQVKIISSDKICFLPWRKIINIFVFKVKIWKAFFKNNFYITL